MDELSSIVLPGWDSLDADLARAPKIVREELLRSMVEVDALLEREVKDATPTATGITRASIFSREEMLPDGVLGVISSSQPHVAYVELGTRPHFPPVEALQDWVRVKFAYTSEREIRSTAFLIARAIARDGTEGAHMFEDTFDRQRTRVVDIFAASRARVAQRLLG